jgi:ribosomal protein L11 methyltransferase
MSYEAWHFKVSPRQPGSEILIALLGEQGFESFETDDSGFTGYVDEAAADAVDLSDIDFTDFTYSFEREKIETVNWNEAWEKSFEPVRIGSQLIIRSSFHQPEKGFTHEIIITPKMSFGTGHHSTTQLMCESLLKMSVEGKKVLDMGCGTAVLAILAAKLGAAHITGIDIDEWSVENSRENCDANGYSKIQVLKGGEELLGEFSDIEILLANINKNILRKQIPKYSAIMKPGGALLLSGFFTSDVDELISVAASAGFEPLETNAKQEWAQLVLKKKD